MTEKKYNIGSRWITLTSRQIQVITLVAAGYTNSQIGKELKLSIETVKAHILSARTKLDAENRTHIIAIAYKYGILPPPLPRIQNPVIFGYAIIAESNGSPVIETSQIYRTLDSANAALRRLELIETKNHKTSQRRRIYALLDPPTRNEGQ